MSLSYSDVRQKSSHNSYYQSEGIYDQFFYWRIHSLEFDFNVTSQHSGLDGVPDAQSVPRDWFIYEDSSRTNVNRLSDVFEVLRGIHYAEPDHQVITVFLCAKDALDQGDHSAQILDSLVARLDSDLGGNAVYRAAQHSSYGPWPTLDVLQGKFIFALTSNPFLDPFITYAKENAADCCIFLAPELDHMENMASSGDYLEEFTTGKWKNAVFANINFYTWKNTPGLRDLPAQLAQKGIISRAYPRTFMAFDLHPVDNLDSPEEWRLAKDAGFHHIATDKINSLVDPYSYTNAPNGWPFELRTPTSGMAMPVVGKRAVISVQVTSGDICGEQDSFAFTYAQYRPEDANRTLISYIASPNSCVEGWAKGGLMARTSLDVDADYFAILRPADDHRFQVQWRKKGQSSYRYKEIFLGDNQQFQALGFRIKPDTLLFARLDILSSGCRAIGSVALHWRGASTQWIQLDDEIFDAPLLFQGSAASSHDGSKSVLFQFGDLGSSPGSPVVTLLSVGVGSCSSQVNSYPPY